MPLLEKSRLVKTIRISYDYSSVQLVKRWEFRKKCIQNIKRIDLNQDIFDFFEKVRISNHSR